jgi:cytochrome c oxidase subunit 2
MHNRLKQIIFSFFTLLIFSSNAIAEYGLNMTRGVTPVSRDIYDLHMTIFWICVVLAIAVFSVMIYAIMFHRKALGCVPAKFHESTTVEIIWTIIPVFILVGMAWPATKVLIDMEDNSKSDMTIKVTGYMWKWHYDYLGQEVRFESNLATPMEQINGREPKGKNYLLEVDNPLVLPINKKIRFITTANDVIHSWWVPALGIKKDAVPGFANEAWAIINKPGIYRGQCAELCGARHGFMPIVVIAKSELEYEKWLKNQKKN